MSELLNLFDGIGSFSIAYAQSYNKDLKELSYCSSEIEPFLQNVLSSNFKNIHQLGDITKIKDEELANLNVKYLTMGTPCTGFSISGEREGLENDQSSLFLLGVDVIKKVQPEYFIWENVFGVFSSLEGQDFRSVLNQFKNIGYDVIWSVLDTKYFGLPQNRRRVYMIGSKNGIKKENDLFHFSERQNPEIYDVIKSLHFEFDNNKTATNPKDYDCFFNFQRSDYLKEIGLSNTLAKRDYKSSTNLVVKNGIIRKVTPKERLRLQGIPDYWFDHIDSKYQKSDKPKYQANGMSVPVVKYVFDEIKRLESGACYNNYKPFKSVEFVAESSFDIFKNKDNAKRKYKNIPNSGQMILDRDENCNVISNLATYVLVEKCTESSPHVVESSIFDFILDDVPESYNATIKSCLGKLRREYNSKKPLPKKLKDVIFYMYPILKQVDFSKDPELIDELLSQA